MSHAIETFEVVEGTTPDYLGQILDKDDNPVPGSVLDSLTLTVHQEYTGDIVNSRNEQNVLQVNGVSVDETGLIRWTLSLGDASILNDALHQEPHIAKFKLTYPGTGGTEVSEHEVRLLVTNLEKVS